MAAPKTIRNKAGDHRRASSAIQVPPNLAELALAIDQLQHSLNAVIVVYNAHTHTAPAAAVWTGAVVSAHSSGLKFDITDGELRNAAGTYVPVTGQTSGVSLTTAHATLARVDLVQAHLTTGVVTKKDGTAGASPVAPAVDAGNIALATIAVAATATTPGAITDVRPRFGVGATATASQVDGTAQAAADLFTTV